MKRLWDFISPDRTAFIAFLLFLFASPSYYFCRQHCCCGGHLEHPPYPLTTYLNDGFWIGGFAVSLLLALFRSDVTFRYRFIFALGVGYLFFSRSGGSTGILEIPIQIALCLFSAACLKGWIE